MNATITQRAEEYIRRVGQLYALAEAAARPASFSVSRRPVHLNEEHVGEYDVEELTLALEGKVRARFIPVGASIIGAQGRVDLKGEFGEESLFYLLSNGPSLTGGLSAVFPAGDSYATHFFRNINEDGWYWAESVRLGKAKLVTPDLIVELIASVN